MSDWPEIDLLESLTRIVRARVDALGPPEPSPMVPKSARNSEVAGAIVKFIREAGEWQIMPIVNGQPLGPCDLRAGILLSLYTPGELRTVAKMLDDAGIGDTLDEGEIDR